MKFRTILIVLALLGLFLIGWLNLDAIVEAFRLVKSVRWQWLLLMPLIQLISYYSNARYYQTFLADFGHRVSLKKLYELSLALNFVNKAIPSAGLSGASFLSYRLKNKVPVGRTTLMQLGRYVLTYFSYALLLVAAVTLLYFGGGIDKITVRIIVLLASGFIVGAVVFVFVLNSQARLKSAVRFFQQVIDRLSRLFRRAKKPLIGKERIERVMTDFQHGYTFVTSEWRRLRKPFLYALLGNISELATLYVVFVAFGELVNLGAVIISYAAANATGLITIIPADLGVYEATMVATLTSTGISLALGLSATLIYRIVNMLVFLPIGFYFYTKHIKK